MARRLIRSIEAFGLSRDLSHQPVVALPFPEGLALLATPRSLSEPMSQMQIARENIATHISPEATHQFDVALHEALLSSIASMDELHVAVCQCARALRNANVGPVQLILAMKACAIDSAGRYRPLNDEYPVSNVDLLIDHIVRWSIEEYYKTVS